MERTHNAYHMGTVHTTHIDVNRDGRELDEDIHSYHPYPVHVMYVAMVHDTNDSVFVCNRLHACA